MDGVTSLMSKLDELRKEIKENKKKLDDLGDKMDRLEEKTADNELEGKEVVLEIAQIPIKSADGQAASKEAARIIKESKGGVEKGKVESITGKSDKTARRIMRKMAEEFEFLKYRKGDNTKPSKLYHADYAPGV